MKTIFYHTAKFSRFIPLQFLKLITRQKAIFPVYHLVSDHNVNHIKHLYKIRSLKQFENDLDFFLKAFKPLQVNDLIHSTQTGKGMKPGFLLSFDDGLREFYDVVAPVLIKRGIPAICFLNTGFIDNKDLFFRYKASILIEEIRNSGSNSNQLKDWCRSNNLVYDDAGRFLLSVGYLKKDLLDSCAALMNVDYNEYLKINQPYLTGEQIRSLGKKGFIFGAHSIDHPCYTDISTDLQIVQTQQSMRDVVERFNPPYRLFSFPFTDHGVTAALFETLFSENPPLVDLSFGCAGLKLDSYHRHIQRIPIESGNLRASDIVTGEYIYFLLKALMGKNKIIRK